VVENVHKMDVITKLGLFDWLVMPFGMKIITILFLRQQ
jgi:hypothetical protein